MSRRLSNIEWVTFQDEIDVDKMDLPPWGAAIEWRGMNVLAYRPQADCNWMADLIGTCPVGELFLSDITDLGNLNDRFPKYYDAYANSWWYQLPQASLEILAERAAQSGQLIDSAGSAVVAVARTAGEAAGAATGPLLESLTVPLVIAGVLGVVLLAKR